MNFAKILGPLALLFMTSAYGQTDGPQTVSTDSTTFLDKWGMDYSNYLNGPTFKDTKGEYSIDHYLGLGYKWNDDWNTSFVFRTEQNIGSDKDTFVIDDSYIKIKPPKFYQDNNGLSVYSQVRLYLPMKEETKNDENLFKIVPRIYVKKQVDNFSFLYLLSPSIYANKKNVEGQKQYVHKHWMQFSYFLNDRFSLDFAFYPGWTKERGSSVEFNDMPVYPGVTAFFTKDLSVFAYFELISMDARRDNTMIGANIEYSIF